MSTAVDHLRLMARNNAYANELLLEACCRLSATDFVAERTGFFPSICLTLQHNLAVDRYYLDALREEGQGPVAFRAKLPDTAAGIGAAQDKSDLSLITFCDGLTEADLDRQIVQDRGPKGVHRETVAATLLHLFQHQIHHRGQVHSMLSGTDVSPPQLDEFFLEFERHPAALRRL